MNQSINWSINLPVFQACLIVHCMFFIAVKSTTDQQAANLSTLFDVGGIFGGILAGYLADVTGSSGIISFFNLVIAAPIVSTNDLISEVNF